MKPIILAAGLLALATPPLAAQFSCEHPGVVDGDTLRCGDGTRVRVWGIQAPERHMAAGPASARAMADLVKGRDLRCIDRGKDRYGRTVAQCFVGRRDIAREMVRRGQAEDWPRYSKGHYSR